MSYDEYKDFFLKAQKDGKYHLFVFDIVNSRTIINRSEAQLKMIDLAFKLFEEIRNIEIKTNKKILVFSQRNRNLLAENNANEFGLKPEPFIFGDAFGITVYRDSIPKDEFLEIYNKLKTKMKIDFSFHEADAFYETNYYEEGNKKYYRGYCVQQLTELHKKTNEDVRAKLKVFAIK